MKFNELIDSYLSLLDPTMHVDKRKKIEDKQKIFEEFKKEFSLPLAKGKFKNFKRAT